MKLDVHLGILCGGGFPSRGYCLGLDVRPRVSSRVGSASEGFVKKIAFVQVIVVSQRVCMILFTHFAVFKLLLPGWLLRTSSWGNGF
jgi:hypothetical protein